MNKMNINKIMVMLLFIGWSFPFVQGSNPVQPTKQISQFDQLKQMIQSSINDFGSSTLIYSELPVVENVDINNAIRKGSANDLSSFLNSSVEIVLPDNEGTFSKAQAQMILASFFSKHPVKSFVVKQDGSSSSTSNFVIGTYTSTLNKDFRVYYVTKKVGNKELIQHIEFELK